MMMTIITVTKGP